MTETVAFSDLHSHTHHSDGELAPAALVDLAIERGVQALAITDHDTIAGVTPAVTHAQGKPIEIVAGCELTAYHDEIELHILGLFVDYSPTSALTGFLNKMQQARRERALESLRRLRAAGYSVDDADLPPSTTEGQAIGRPHIAAALLKRGAVPTLQAAYSHLLDHGCVGYVPKYKLTPREAIEVIRAAGGVSILAHPGMRPHDELISPMFAQGLDGVEAYYAGHSEINWRFYAGLARRYQKLVSGGSDFHGPRVRPGVFPGDCGVDRKSLEALRQLAERRRANTVAERSEIQIPRNVPQSS
jgi:3',5'-nucleoside bisphosphate phosphatase